MKTANHSYPQKVDLENCAKEPIHIIGSSQEFGLLLVAHPETLRIIQAGSNSAAFLPWEPQELLEKDLGAVFGEETASYFLSTLKAGENPSSREVKLEGKSFLLVPHLTAQHLLLDLEPLQEDADTVQRTLSRLYMDFKQQEEGQSELFQHTARLAKRYFGYDRVMIYRFDEEWNGEVVAEEREPEMQSWYGLHYPATDIPAQSRAMFLKNGIRMISDVHYSPRSLQPEVSPITQAPVDLSGSALRAVSPIHIEYLKNMEVGASLTAAIEVRGKLWGLMAFHHRKPRFLDRYSRETCHFLAQLLAMELTVAETEKYLEITSKTDEKRAQLLQQVRSAVAVPQGLCKEKVKFTDLVACGGGALYLDGTWHCEGTCPSPKELQELLEKLLMKNKETLFHTNSLGTVFPKAQQYKETASGLLSLRLAEDKFLLWFKPETLQTVNWGGDPHNKAVYNEKEQRLSPRKSFEKWTELKKGTSKPWKDHDFNAVKALGDDLSYEYLARQHREIEALNEQLSQANKDLELFSYGLSHDLKAPIRGIDGLLEIIQEDAGPKLGKEEQKHLQQAQNLSRKLEGMIDDILEYSSMSHAAAREFELLETNELLEEALDMIAVNKRYPSATIQVQDDLPQITGDRSMMIQVWTNLLNNALKYSKQTNKPRVEVGSTIEEGRRLFFVKDNGIGFPEKLREAIFEPFKRAVGSGYEGTGIGLALVRKIIEKHGGEIWAKSEVGKGSIFYLYLPGKKGTP